MGCLFRVGEEMHELPLIAFFFLCKEKLKDIPIQINYDLLKDNWEEIENGKLFFMFKPKSAFIEVPAAFKVKFFCLGNLKTNRLCVVGDKEGIIPFYAGKRVTTEKFGDDADWGIENSLFEKSWEDIRNGDLFLFYSIREDGFPLYAVPCSSKKIFFYIVILKINKTFIVSEDDGELPWKAADAVLKIQQEIMYFPNVSKDLVGKRKRWKDIRCGERFIFRMKDPKYPLLKIVLYSPSGVVPPVSVQYRRKSIQ